MIGDCRQQQLPPRFVYDGGCATITSFKVSVQYSGTRFVVICNGAAHEMPVDATLEQATAKAEALAFQHSTEAYILKPVRKVAPKRDVVTTDL